MARGINCFFGIGNFGADPVKKTTPSGTDIVSVGVAFTTKRGESEHTEWIQCKFFNKAAEIIAEYCSKGDRINVRGRIQTDTWNDKNTGAERKQVCCLVDEFMLLGDGKRGSSGPTASAQQYAAATGGSAPAGNDPEDDIPF